MKTKIVLPHHALNVQDLLQTRMATSFRNLRKDDQQIWWRKIQSALQEAIIYQSQEGYKAGALLVGRTVNSTDLIRLRRNAIARAEWVAQEMQGYTERSLMSSKESKLLSKERANKAAVFESRRAFFEGSQKGWNLNKAAKKSWLTSDEHNISDQCDDNEDDGIIDIGDVFSSGDSVPPAHLNCLCSVWIHV